MKNLAIFYGGKSAEHDISILTAIGVMQSLNKEKYNIVPIYVTKNNRWLVLKNYLDVNTYTKNFKRRETLVGGFFNGFLLKKGLFGFKRFKKIDVAINCMHGLNGEDGSLAGLLQLNEIVCVGSGVVASAVGMDKVLQKDIFTKNNIPCAKYTHIHEQQFILHKEEIVQQIENQINYPMVVKPANLGSSIGINISKNREELIKNIEIALNFDKKIIIEEQILNLREINCSVIGNSLGAETSILEEPKNWKTFLDFNEKYLMQNKNGNKKEINVDLGEELNNQIKDLAKKVFNLLGCSGVVRIDFLLDDKTKQIYVNEINTIPGSYSNYLWKHKYSFGALLDELIDMSTKEYLYNAKYKYAFESNVLNQYKTAGKTCGTKFNKM